MCCTSVPGEKSASVPCGCVCVVPASARFPTSASPLPAAVPVPVPADTATAGIAFTSVCVQTGAANAFKRLKEPLKGQRTSHNGGGGSGD